MNADARDLDVAVLERQCQEEFGALAEKWLELLPEDSRLLADLEDFKRLAPRQPTA